MPCTNPLHFNYNYTLLRHCFFALLRIFLPRVNLSYYIILDKGGRILNPFIQSPHTKARLKASQTMSESKMSAPKLFTLIFIREKNKVLLGYKTRGLGAGLWNGFGGKIEKNETIIVGAERELKEESNLQAKLKHVGVVHYYEENKPTNDVVHIFTSDKFNGEIKESEEMSPIRWFDENRMPFEKMWPDARKWIPLMLDNCLFTVHVTYGCDDKVKTFDTKIFKLRDEFINNAF